ncbi:hypothetical protein [Segnochrobactrum spirostomi]|uniref:Uncharacterized protein n=1 Tax=Segnochrobactrum spirostomi TaxID=2608987 RepID=A0A6A7YA14_9HYPH|nr:hypothetical protein [Segnochrobactrum spirostomi]MQT15615.1 hypothetical protein [Segnochrobactrum spirostomi]
MSDFLARSAAVALLVTSVLVGWGSGTGPLATGTAQAEEAMVVQRGTEGLSPVPFRVANQSDQAIVCAAATAHWYSIEIGRAQPNTELVETIWSKPATGEVFALNTHEDHMPIQTLWCGLAGADVSTRTEIRLERKIGVKEPAISLTCTSDPAAHRLACRRLGAE